MIELYYWPTPNGHKITIFLEEANLDYRIVPVDISAGDQFKPEFLRFSPNNRMPAIVDMNPSDGGEPISIFESGAILLYLAEKTGSFLSVDLRSRKTAIEWLFWQMGGLGPMAGQNHHFGQYAPQKIPYAIDRYVQETNRLYGVLDRRLQEHEYLASDYSIADMACYPWIQFSDLIGIPLADFPRVAEWVARIGERPAVKRAYEVGEPIKGEEQMDDEARHLLFGVNPQKT